MSGSIDHALGFWKPLLDQDAMERLAYSAPTEHSTAPGIHIVAGESAPAKHIVVDGDRSFFLFAAVHPIAHPPVGAQVMARITDPDGSPRSFVLWFPRERRLLIPFDPDAAVEAMWLEHYTGPESTVLPGPVLKAYYTVRSVLPSSVRLALRRALASREQGKDGDLGWPADSSLDQLMRLLMRGILLASGRTECPFVWFWPDAHPWAAVLTHDVETANGLPVIPKVMQAETARGLHSSFNFVPRDYELPSELAEHLRASGFEIGVHGYTHDGLLCSSRETFVERAAHIDETAREWGACGFRSPATYRNLRWFDEMAIEYDSSVTDSAPYEPQPGGCGSVFPYVVGDLVELPMTLPQDHTLFGLLRQKDPGVWLDKLDTIRRDNGMACVLTHPDPGPGYIGSERNQAHYLEVLDYLAADDAWTPLPRELARWWKTRSEMPLGEIAAPGACTGQARLTAEGDLRLIAPNRAIVEPAYDSARS